MGEALRVPWSRELVPPCTAVTLCVRDNRRGKTSPHTGVQTARAPGSGHCHHLCGPCRAICQQHFLQQGMWDVPLTLIQPHKPSLSCHHPEPPNLALPGGFYPIFSSAEPGAGREALQEAGGSGEPPINANHFPYTTCFCCRGYLAISGYRVLFLFS